MSSPRILAPPPCSLSLPVILYAQNKLAALAAVCNRYPNVSLEYEVVDADEVSAGEQVQMVVKLERENEVRAPPFVCARACLLCTCPCAHAHANDMWGKTGGSAIVELGTLERMGTESE